jgi:hypothetical protein
MAHIAHQPGPVCLEGGVSRWLVGVVGLGAELYQRPHDAARGALLLLLLLLTPYELGAEKPQATSHKPIVDHPRTQPPLKARAPRRAGSRSGALLQVRVSARIFSELAVSMHVPYSQFPEAEVIRTERNSR